MRAASSSIRRTSYASRSCQCTIHQQDVLHLVAQQATAERQTALPRADDQHVQHRRATHRARVQPGLVRMHDQFQVAPNVAL
jgi:hypothetical protein